MSDQNNKSTGDIALIFDGQCPVCTAYSCAVEVDGVPDAAVRRVDARGDHALVQQAIAAGLDLDEGMVVVQNGKLHHGADALHLMARLAPRRGIKNRLNRFLFGSRTLGRLSYPVLRAGRNMLLRVLGRKKIGQQRHQPQEAKR